MDNLKRAEIVKSGTDEVTAEWLTDIVRRSFPRDDAVVSDFEILTKNQLPYSTVARVRVQYGGLHAELPDSFFLKLTPGTIADSHTKAIGKTEVDFYRRLAPEMSCPPLVRCFEAQYSERSGRGYLLLEDLSETHSQPRQNSAPSESASYPAIEALAKAHAAWWNDSRLGTEVGQLFDDATLAGFIENLESSVAEFITDPSVVLTSEQKDAYRSMLLNVRTIWGRLSEPHGLTITHGDCHWWNFLYPRDSDVHAVRIFDWHLWHVDLGARDLAFLLALGGFAEPRVPLEEDLLRTYHRTLVANGVADYSWEKLRNDYRWSAIRNLNIPVIFRSQGKHKTTWQTALRRALDSYERLRCRDLFA
jgi:hypothetical protein